MLEQSALAEKLGKISDPRKWLMSTGHFKRLEYPSSGQTMVSGQDISEHYKKIEPDVPEDIRWMLIALVDYIRAPFIVDDFSSETERNAWQRMEVHGRPEVNRLFESNKLKGNFISNVLSIGQLAESEGWLDPELVRKYTELNGEYAGPDGPPRGYDKKKIEEKIAFTEKISDLAKDLCQAIAKKNAPEMLK